MTDLHMRFLTHSSAAAGTTPSLLGRLLGVLSWVLLASMALVFVASVLVWASLAVVFSLIASVFTGRPPAVAVLWRRYRDLARTRWPQPRAESTTPRADATDVAAAARAADVSRVDDVAWREVPTAADPVRSADRSAR